jgi:hypothetical protein
VLLRAGAGADNEDDDHAAWLVIDGASGIEDDDRPSVPEPRD